MSVLYNYEKDPITFANSGLEKQKLYVEIMTTIKDSFFEVIGRGKFYDDGYSNETRDEPGYKSPDDTNLDEIWVPEDEKEPIDLGDDVVVLPF